MDAVDLFAVALNLPSPWRISQVEFKPSKESSLELHIYIAFQRGGRFPCPQEPCGKSFPAYDTAPRTWRHLNFFQYKTCIHADLPRIQCEKHGVKTVQVPWAREGSGFTLLFESRIAELSKHLPVAVIARMVEEHDTRLWRFIRHCVEKAGEAEDYAGVANIGIDETGKKGHKYITVVADLAQRKVIFVTEGKDSTTVRRFAADFEAHSGKCEKVHLVTCDMSLGFRKGIRETFEKQQNRHRQIPCNQARQRSCGQSAQGGSQTECNVEELEIFVVEERGQSDGKPAGKKGNSSEEASENSTRLCHAC